MKLELYKSTCQLETVEQSGR